MPVLITRQNATVATSKTLSLRQQNRNIGQVNLKSKNPQLVLETEASKAGEMNVDGVSAVPATVDPSSNQAIANPETEQRPQSRLQTSDIEAKKYSVESWLKSQLSLEGSCKTMIEAHLVDKFRSRSLAEKKIRWDMTIFVMYILFLLFYSFAACGTNTKGKQMVRTLIEAVVGDFSSVQSIGRIDNVSRFHISKFTTLFCR